MGIEAINIDSYQLFIESHSKVVVHFWADWNLHDREMRKRLSALSDTYNGLIAFASFDTSPEEHWEKCRELKILNLPTLVLYKSGKHYETVISSYKEEEIKKVLDRLLNAE